MTVDEIEKEIGDETEALDVAARHLWYPRLPYAMYRNRERGPIQLVRGEGVFVWDDQGRRYYDGSAGLCVVNVGHGRAELRQAALEQMEALAYHNPVAGVCAPTAELARRLAALAPGELNRVFFTPSGSTAIEVALRIARQFHYNRGERRRYKVVTRYGSYHGMTGGALAVNVSLRGDRVPSEPMGAGGLPVAGLDCYRCSYERTYPECEVFCARYIESVIESEGPQTVAAVLAEPLDTAYRGQVPPAEYWPTIREICDRHGVLLIADEVVTGLGRTGRWFASEHFGVTPDLIAVAKGLTSGHVAAGATIASDRVFGAFEGMGEQLGVISSFAGQPVASRVALANLEILEREGLVDNARRLGELLGEELGGLRQRLPLVGNVQGMGLLWSIQLVQPDGAYFAPAQAPRLAGILDAHFKRNEVLMLAADRIIMAPPLCITKDELLDLLARVEAALVAAAEELGAGS